MIAIISAQPKFFKIFVQLRHGDFTTIFIIVNIFFGSIANCSQSKTKTYQLFLGIKDTSLVLTYKVIILTLLFLMESYTVKMDIIRYYLLQNFSALKL